MKEEYENPNPLLELSGASPPDSGVSNANGSLSVGSNPKEGEGVVTLSTLGEGVVVVEEDSDELDVVAVVEGAKLSVTLASSAAVLGAKVVVAKLGITDVVVELFISGGAVVLGAVVVVVLLAGQQIGSATAFIPEQISLSSSVFNASTIKSPHVLATVMAVSSSTVIPPVFEQTSHGTCAGVGQQVSCASCIMEQPTSLASVRAASASKSAQVLPWPMTILSVPAVIPSRHTSQDVVVFVVVSLVVVETMVLLSEGAMVGATDDVASVPLTVLVAEEGADDDDEEGVVVVVALFTDSEQQVTSDTFISVQTSLPSSTASASTTKSAQVFIAPSNMGVVPSTVIIPPDSTHT